MSFMWQFFRLTCHTQGNLQGSLECNFPHRILFVKSERQHKDCGMWKNYHCGQTSVNQKPTAWYFFTWASRVSFSFASCSHSSVKCFSESYSTFAHSRVSGNQQFIQNIKLCELSTHLFNHLQHSNKRQQWCVRLGDSWLTIRHDMYNTQHLMCTQKLTCIQLSLLQGTKQKINDGKLNRNPLSVKIEKNANESTVCSQYSGQIKGTWHVLCLG